MHVKRAVAKLEKDIIRRRIAVEKRRPDGRATDEIRPISSEVSVVPRTHGSALFTRGETQAMSLLTLGGTGEFQRIDGLGIEDKKRYIHHYNFPPYSVGETGFMRGPKRRDIGHGALAERALLPVLPDEVSFPYTIRIVSEILESNGSSSMASVCGSTLSLMDAGVQISAPVAGTAMGLIKEGDDYVVLTDIAGVEDHLGDMDFKVAGTAEGITALQMDIKITGVTFEILTEALEQARKARLFILGKMLETIAEPRSELSEWAPRIFSIQINPDQIGLVIGKGGETIRGMTEEFSADIDIQDDGTIFICAPDEEAAEGVKNRIQSMTKEVEVGDVFTGRVVKTTDFGAFVELKKGTDGLLHISRLGAQGRAREERRGRRQARRHRDGRGRRDRQGAQPHRADAPHGARGGLSSSGAGSGPRRPTACQRWRTDCESPPSAWTTCARWPSGSGSPRGPGSSRSNSAASRTSSST